MLKTLPRNFQRPFLLFALLLLEATPALTQESFPLPTARFAWDWTPGSNPGVDDSQPTEFRIKCGHSTGQYSFIATAIPPDARTWPVRSVIGGSGTYYCVVTAANAAGESAPSNEVFFSAVATVSSPTNPRVIPK